LTPTLARVRKDKPRIYDDGCHADVKEVDVPYSCVYGDRGSSTTVVLFGDSHAAQWFPAMDHLARQHGWRLVSLTKSSCTAGDVYLYEDSLKRPYTECQTWRANVFRRIEELQPALVVVSSLMDDRRLTGDVAD